MTAPDIEKLAGLTSPLHPSSPEESYTGKLVGWLDDGPDSVACLRIPRNGLWWYAVVDPEAGLGGEDGFDDRWLVIPGKPEVYRPSNRPILGAWTKATARRNGHLDFDLEQLPARRVEMAWHRRARPTHEQDPYSASPTWDRPFFPDDPGLQRWSERTFNASLDTGLEDRPLDQYGWARLSLCTCQELGCGSVFVDLQPAGDEAWLEWREVHGGHYGATVLGPWLKVPAQPRIVQMPPLEDDLDEENSPSDGSDERGERS